MPKTYNDIYFSVRNKLRESGVEAFSLEARILLAAAAGKTTEQLMRDMYLYTSPEIEERAHSMIERRLQGEPLAYISGSWEFYGLPMTVTPDVLIPRMDTEILVDAAIDAIKGFGMKGRVLDLCCGSGCIACAIANELPAARVVAADISPSALEVCRKNIKDNKLTSRIIPMNADATTWPPMSIGSFDVIVSNPPYIPSFELIELDCSVRDYEPMTALDGGEDGLDFYRTIIEQAPKFLDKKGILVLEIGYNQAEEISAMLEETDAFAKTEIVRDYGGNNRVVCALLK